MSNFNQNVSMKPIILKTMWPPNHHQNGFVATQALGNMIYVMCTDLRYCI